MEIALLVLVAVAGGLVKGITGFGYALVSTVLLLLFLPAETAVSLMILPLIASNLEVIRETDLRELMVCARRFWHYLVPLLAGALTGIYLTGLIPEKLFTASLGLFALSYSLITLIRSEWFDRLADRCFTHGGLVQGITGLFSGIIYGATNTGVQIVAYLDSKDLEQKHFTGMIALSILGVSLVRLVAATNLGYFRGIADIQASLLMAAAGVFSVFAGRKLSMKLEEDKVAVAARLLLGFIGLRLTASGLGIV